MLLLKLIPRTLTGSGTRLSETVGMLVPSLVDIVVKVYVVGWVVFIVLSSRIAFTLDGCTLLRFDFEFRLVCCVSCITDVLAPCVGGWVSTDEIVGTVDCVGAVKKEVRWPASSLPTPTCESSTIDIDVW